MAESRARLPAAIRAAPMPRPVGALPARLADLSRASAVPSSRASAVPDSRAPAVPSSRAPAVPSSRVAPAPAPNPRAIAAPNPRAAPTLNAHAQAAPNPRATPALNARVQAAPNLAPIAATEDDGLVGEYGLRIPEATLIRRLGAKGLAKLQRSMTVTEKKQRGTQAYKVRPVSRAAYKIETAPNPRGVATRYVRFPRTKAAGFIRNGLIQRAVPHLEHPAPWRLDPANCEIADGRALFDYQTAAVDYLTEGEGAPFGATREASYETSAYLQLDTGLGKTVLGGAVAARLRVPTLIVVPTEAMAQQTIDDLAMFFPRLVVGWHKNTQRHPPTAATHDVVLCVINTFRKKEPEFIAGYGLIVLDEAHELHSKENSKALWLAQTKVLGLSATPAENPSGMDMLVPLHLGRIINQNELPGFDVDAVAYAGEVWRVLYAGHPDHCETAVTAAGTSSAIMTIGNVNKDPDRLRLFVGLIQRVYKLHETPAAARYGLGPDPNDATAPIRRHGILIFTEHREQLPLLQAALLERFARDDFEVPELDDEVQARLVAGEEEKEGDRSMTMLRGGVAHDELGKARRAGAHIVLSTYGYTRRGISLVKMSTIAFWSPRRNGMVQILGRARRRGSDRRIVRLTIDFVDTRTSLKSQSNDRNKVYKALGYAVRTIKVAHDGVDDDEALDAALDLDAAPNAADASDEEKDAGDPLDALFG